ncbi:MAG: hypothetical protein PVF43_05960 [Candidatus Eiseniibacteriota bacterium]|jgi:hypothetical protein
MRPRSWGVLILAGLLIAALATSAGAYKESIAVSDEHGHARGGSSDTWDGGDPDGVGLENPEGAFGPPMSPVFREQGTSSSPLGDDETMLRTLWLVLETVQLFTR